MTTDIVFASSLRGAPDEWLQALQRTLPSVRFVSLTDAAAAEATMAVVWDPARDLFRRAPGLQVLFNLGAGVDALLQLDGMRDDVAIVRLEDAGMATQMAEYVIYWLLHETREFGEYERQARQGAWIPRSNIERGRWPVGVMGLGVIGARVAAAVAALGYDVAGWARHRKQIPRVTSYAGDGEWSAFLQRTRVLVNLLPLTAATRGILSSASLRQLQPGAVVVNAGRGAHLVASDLLQLIHAGRIAHAVLDVTDPEPLPPTHPLWREPRVIITPHIAAATLRDETVRQVAEKINRYLDGRPFGGSVVRERGY